MPNIIQDIHTANAGVPNMKLLKGKRAQIKAQCTRFSSYLAALDVQNTSIVDLRQRLRNSMKHGTTLIEDKQRLKKQRLVQMQGIMMKKDVRLKRDFCNHDRTGNNNRK